MRIEKKVTEKDNKSDKQVDTLNEDHRKGKLSFLIASFFVIALFAVFYFFVSLEKRNSDDLLKAVDRDGITEISYDIELLPYGSLSDDLDFSKISAEVVYAYNPVTHQVFYEKNSTLQSSIASITKLLTILVASEVYEPTTVLTASKYDVEDFYWVLELEEGDQMTYEDAVHAMLLSSFNDVAFMVADNYPGGYQEFIKKMNDTAGRFGMIDSNFSNPSGLDNDNHYSTARDLKKLVQKALESKEIMDVVSKYSAQVEIRKASGEVVSRTVVSTNQLLGTNAYLKGLKTGSTEDAGECFISYWSAGDHDQLITILLNSEARFDETEELFDLLKTVKYSN